MKEGYDVLIFFAMNGSFSDPHEVFLSGPKLLTTPHC